MIQTIVSALLPVLVILFLGYFSGRHKDFSMEQASVLNTMIMLYTLPLSLFCGVITTSLDQILEQKDLLIGLMTGMVGFYLLIFFFLRYILRREIKISALLTLSICSPAVPFVGASVLGELLGGISTLVISISSLIINLIQMPLTIILLSIGSNSTANKNIETIFFPNILNACKQPVVWAPVLALLLVVLKTGFPPVLIKSFELLGSTTAGIALFSSGIILYSYKVTFNKTIGISVLIKNLLLPFAVWGIIYMLEFSPVIIKETILSLSIPTASTAIILSIQYKTAEQEISSILFYSTVLSVITMGIFIWLL